jgi:4-amino-4-deoxy-L-arabinose transferase-like glycosyltransferase
MKLQLLKETKVPSVVWLGAFIILGFTLRFYVFLNATTISVDSFNYVNMAKGFLEGDLTEGINVIRRPLYPLLLGLSSNLTGDYELAGRIVSLAFGTAAIAVSFYLARSVYNERAGLFAAFFVAIHPYMVRYSGDVLTEGLYYFLVAMLVLFGLKAVSQRSTALMSAAALFAILAYLTRPGAIIIWAVITIWAVSGNFTRIRQDWRERVGPLVVGCLIFITMAVPYIILTPGAGGELDIGNGLSLSSLEPVLSILFSFGLGERILKFLADFPKGFTLPFLALFIFGVFVRKREGFSSSEFYLMAIMLITWLFYLCVSPSERYFVHLMPIALVFSAAGFCHIEDRLKARARRPVLLTAALVLAICAVELPQGLVSLHAHRLPERQAGEWLKEHAEGPYTIMARRPIIAFYADGGFVFLPGETMEEVIEYGKQEGAEYVAGYTSSLRKNIPDFDLEKERFLTELRRFSAGRDDEFVLYRVAHER